MTPRIYKIALAVSLLLNVLAVTGIWYYASIAETLDLVKTVVEMFN